MTKREQIYNLFFNLNKSTVEISIGLNVTKQYVSKILKKYYAKEYAAEKENRKAINKEKREAKKYDAKECHFMFRDRPIAPNETMTTKGIIDCCRSHYKTEKKTGIMHYVGEGRTKDLPSSYNPNDEFKNKYKCHCFAIVIDIATKEKFIYKDIKYTVKAYDDYIARIQARNRFTKSHIDQGYELEQFYVEKIEYEKDMVV